MSLTAFTCARLFDGDAFREGQCLLVEGRRVAEVMPAGRVPGSARRVDLGGGIIAPGFVDLQVNGAGGVLLNAAPSVETIETMCRAAARCGVTRMLPTLISDRPETTAQAIAAGRAAADRAVPGFGGLHLEGPHLAAARHGAHDPDLIRPMTPADLDALCAAAARLPHLLVTVAPEIVGPEQIARLTAAGATVSLGHSAATHAQGAAAVEAGARCATHLFNAMSGLHHREPGLVGLALDDGRLHAGIIADGVHVHPVVLSAALRAKHGPGRLFLVTDAMPPMGTEMTEFRLGERRILRRGGRLELADGTLAGADLDMAKAVRVMIERVGLDPAEALRMAGLYPAAVIGAGEIGRLSPGMRADFVHLDDGLHVRSTWIGGACRFRAEAEQSAPQPKGP